MLYVRLGSRGAVQCFPADGADVAFREQRKYRWHGVADELQYLASALFDGPADLAKIVVQQMDQFVALKLVR